MSAEPIPFAPQGSLAPLPFNPLAEQEVLGAILLHNPLYHQLNSFLKPEHFYYLHHQRVWEACATLIDRGERADPVTLRSHFDGHEAFPNKDGPAYLIKLARTSESGHGAEAYARVIHDHAMRRNALGAVEHYSGLLRDTRVEEPAETLIEALSGELQAIPDHGRHDDRRPELAGKIAHRVIAQTEAIVNGGIPPGLRCGITSIDKRLGGFYRSDVTILAGRPSMGKTSLAEEIMLGAAQKGHACAFFSLEQGREAVVQRLVSRLSGIPYQDMRTGEGITRDSIKLMRRAEEQLNALPLFIDDTGARTPQSIQSEILKLSVKTPIVFAAVDYLQLARSGQRFATPVAEITAVSQGLKGVAKKLNIPMLVLSQLSRASENREDKRPQLSDLRESGAIEQDADIVAFLHREEYYHSRKEPLERTSPEWHEWADKMDKIRNRADLLIQKNRMGRIGQIELACELPINKFTDPVIPQQDYPDGYGGRY